MVADLASPAVCNKTNGGGPAGGGGPPAAHTVEEALARVTTNAGECSALAHRRPGEPCSSKEVIALIHDFVVDTTTRRPLPDSQGGGRAKDSSSAPRQQPLKLAPDASFNAKVIQKAASVLGCGSEACVVTHPKLRNYVGPKGAEQLSIESEVRFKPKGPRSSDSLLNNTNIDQVLQEWATQFSDFFNYDYNMIDFERTGGSLARIDVARILEGTARQSLGKYVGGITARPCRTFGCVLNTDVSTGRGKHWVALFGDCRGTGEWSVEYFDSVGNPPPTAVTRWLEETAARLRSVRADAPQKFGSAPVAAIPLTAVRHQNSQTECGVYTLYYIRRRLEGAKYSEFLGTRISDAAMLAFRKHLFRPES